MPHRIANLAPLVALAALALPAAAQIVHDEAVDGDLSGVATAPTPVTLGLGSNIVNGSTTRANAADGDRDFLTFTIAEGQRLTGLFLLAFAPDNTAFHAINAGDVGIVPSGPGAGDVTQYLGAQHLDLVTSEQNLLEGFSADNTLVGSGFSGGLGAGTYTYVIQQTGSELTTYSLNFVVAPAPSTLLALGLAGGLAARRRR